MNEELTLLIRPLLGTFKIGHGRGAQDGIVVHSKLVWQVAVVVSLGVRMNPAAQLNCTTELG